MTSSAFISYLDENNIVYNVSDPFIFFTLDSFNYMACLIADNILFVDKNNSRIYFFELSDLLDYHKSLTSK